MPDPSRIMRMASAFQESCLLFAGVDAGIFGALAEQGPTEARQLAEDLDLSERGVRLLADACVAIGLLEKDGELYRNAPDSGAFLVPGSPGDLSAALRYNRDVYSAWGKLAEFARTGQPVEKPGLHLGENPGRTRTFALSMHGKAMAQAPAVMPLLNLHGRKRLLDVGGGPGTFSSLAAAANPGLSCTVLELPAIAGIGEELLRVQGTAERVKMLPGDYHVTPFPPGNDVIFFFGMMHQEPPAVICDLLERAYAALLPGGVVYVMDMMTDASHVRPAFSALFAVNMALTKEHGWVFSDSELQTWMESTGFKEFEVTPLPAPMPHWLASAHKPITAS